MRQDMAFFDKEENATGALTARLATEVCSTGCNLLLLLLLLVLSLRLHVHIDAYCTVALTHCCSVHCLRVECS
jgi:hypothetical protein